MEACFRLSVSSGIVAEVSTASDITGHSRRSDAERNRALIVAAADQVFAERGLSAPMSEVAKRAGVGIATVARNFTTREELIAATFGATMTLYADAVARALADPDPWHGFCLHLQTVCGMQVKHQGFNEVLTMTFPNAPGIEAERGRAYRNFSLLVRRAKTAGALRADFSPQDLPVMLMANAGVVGAAGAAAGTASRRLVGYLLQACAADGARPLPAAPSARQLFDAIERIADRSMNQSKSEPRQVR